MQSPTVIDPRKARWIAWGFVALLFGSAWLPRMARTEMVQISIWVAAGLCALGLFLLRHRTLVTEFQIRKPPVVQIGTQGAIYLYWSMNFEPVADQLWLVAAQLVFVYVLDLILSWWKQGRWFLGFGPFPIVGSVNLFLWFRDEWWYLQVLMLVITIGSKHLLRWKRYGREFPVFNPSAIALAALSLSVLLTDNTDITWGQTIASGLNVPTHMFELLFLAGVTVQILFDTTLVTMTAAVTVWMVGLAYHQVTGLWFFHDSHIPISVFLGMNLLITDPSTSPRDKIGRVIFGACYGLCVFPLWITLEAFGQPTFFDKLLQVPVLNLLVPAFERLSARLSPMIPRWSWASNNLVHVAIWCLLFSFLRPGLIDHPGASLTHGRMFASGQGAEKDPMKAAALFDKACQEENFEGCNELARLLIAGTGIPRDIERGLALYTKACAGDEFHACTSLGAIHFDGSLVQRDTRRAAELYSKACEGGVLFVCTNLAFMLSSGDGAARDPRRAIQLFERGCAAGNLGSCDGLGLMVYRGDGAAADPGRARQLHKRACDGGELNGCANLASILADPNGVSRNVEQAIALHERACDGGLMRSCNELGRRYATGDGVLKDMARAAVYAERACTGGHLSTCTNLAKMYYRGVGVKLDPARGRKVLEFACQKGLPKACEMLRAIP